MKKIIILFISIISILQCFAQTDNPKNQISLKYTNSYTEGKYFYFVEGESISFTLDSNKNYQTKLYEHRSKPFKFKIDKSKIGRYSYKSTPNPDIPKIPPISKNDIDRWIKSLRENNYKKHDFSLKEHFKTLTNEDIINIAKKRLNLKSLILKMI